MVSQATLLAQRQARQAQQAAERAQESAPAVDPRPARRQRKDNRTHKRIVSTSTPAMMQVRQELHGIVFKFEKRNLDLFEVLANSDRQFATARRVAMDTIAEMESTLFAYVQQQIGDVLAAVAAIEEEPEEASQ